MYYFIFFVKTEKWKLWLEKSTRIICVLPQCAVTHTKSFDSKSWFIYWYFHFYFTGEILLLNSIKNFSSVANSNTKYLLINNHWHDIVISTVPPRLSKKWQLKKVIIFLANFFSKSHLEFIYSLVKFSSAIV